VAVEHDGQQRRGLSVEDRPGFVAALFEHIELCGSSEIGVIRLEVIGVAHGQPERLFSPLPPA